jgi:hypothetical protein
LFPIATNLDDDNPYNLSDEEKAIIMNTLSW